MLLGINEETPSSSLPYFTKWLWKLQIDRHSLHGLEMGCGKGRNCIALATQGLRMTGFDFSEVAIAEAKKRAEHNGIAKETTCFLTQDAREHWPFHDAQFDFGLDCFATTDLETPEGRSFARGEFLRVLKPGGFLCVATISSESPYHHEKLARAASPGGEGFLLEKTYDEADLRAFYAPFTLLDLQRVKKQRAFTIDGVAHDVEDYWLVLQKR